MTPAQTEAYVDAAAAALGLRLAPAYRPGVVHYVALAAAFAAVIDAVPLAPSQESALSFVPVAPAEKEA